MNRKRQKELVRRRRNDKKRMIRKSKRVYKEVKYYYKYADNLAVCSCPMCGNPRRHFKEKTIKEKINDINIEEIEEELKQMDYSQ